MSTANYSNYNIFQTSFLFLSILMASVIILDFALPGKAHYEVVTNITKERQQYYNAAKNYHYSFKLITTNHSFYVSKSFANQSQTNQKIAFTISPIFKQVNQYHLIKQTKKHIYSLRYATGLFLPILIILVMIFSYRYKEEVSILTFVFQALLIADLIYLVN